MWRAQTVCALLLIGCAEGGTPDVSSAQQGDVAGVLKEHKELEQRLGAVPSGDREECELHAGDCLVLVRERREALVGKFGFSSCGAGYARPDDCLFDQLKKANQHGELEEYVTFKNWCMNRVLACTSDADVKAKAKGVEVRAQTRKQTIETKPPALAGWNAVETARQRLAYLRATLPPKAGEGLCEIAEVSSCLKGVEKQLKEFDATLLADAYEEPQAVQVYADLKRSEAACFDPELKCLSDALNPYGMFPESRKQVDQNLASIAERQRLAVSAAPEAEVACVSDLEARHQPLIEAAFQTYARDPVLFFRLKLDKAYLTLHQAQIDCLKSPSTKPVGGQKVLDLD
jgi:hypothetical protein